MWVIFAGRLTKTMVRAMSEYTNNEIVGIEMLEDLTPTIGKDKNPFNSEIDFSRVSCFIIMDAGLHTLRDWTPVLKLKNNVEGKPILLFSRYPELTPGSDFFGEGISLIIEEQKIYLREMIQLIEEIEATKNQKQIVSNI